VIATDTLLSALAADPGDEAAWLALADSLEEQGLEQEAELTRLREWLRRAPLRAPHRTRTERRVQQLLAEGVRPVMPSYVLPLARGIELTFVLIPPGRFWMGSPGGESGRYENESPRHQVDLTRPFWLATTPITQRQWKAIMRLPGSQHRGADRPVTRMSWYECLDVCRQLTERASRPLRLPTEAEWEYACRAGTTTPFYSGADEDSANKVGWHKNTPSERTQQTGRKQPNAWGLCDMHGNVWEWCLDGKRRYQSESIVDPVCELEEDTARVLRGGSCDNAFPDARAACRGWANHAERAGHWGCRLAIAFDQSDPVLRVLERRA
jgi:uncharacterized protein (TIGR02996 family)